MATSPDTPGNRISRCEFIKFLVVLGGGLLLSGCKPMNEAATGMPPTQVSSVASPTPEPAPTATKPPTKSATATTTDTPTPSPIPTATLTATPPSTETPTPEPLPQTCASAETANKIAEKFALERGYPSINAAVAALVEKDERYSKWFSLKQDMFTAVDLGSTPELYGPESVFNITFNSAFYVGNFDFKFPGNNRYPPATGTGGVFAVPYKEAGIIKAMVVPAIIRLNSGGSVYESLFRHYKNDDMPENMDLSELAPGSRYSITTWAWQSSNDIKTWENRNPQKRVLYKYISEELIRLTLPEKNKEGKTYRQQKFGFDFPSTTQDFIKIINELFLGGEPIGWSVFLIGINSEQPD